MQTILLIAHVAVALGLIGLVLIQHGKGADAGAAFGSGASATVFGARGSGSFLTRTTAILATLFFLLSMGLAYLSANREQPRSVTEMGLATPAVVEQQAPATGETQPADVPAIGGGEQAPADLPKP